MKLLGILLVVLFLVGFEPVFAQETAAEVVTVSAPSSVSVTTVMKDVFSIFAHVIGVIMLAIVPWFAKIILAKLNIQANDEMMVHVESAAITAVAAAEEWGNNQGDKPTGNAKLDKALQVLKQLMKSDIVVQFTDEKLKEILHSVLTTNRGMIEAHTPTR